MLVAPLFLAAATFPPVQPAPLLASDPLLQAAAPPAQAAPAPPPPQRPSGLDARTRFAVLIGLRQLDDEVYWEPLEEPVALEADMAWRLQDSFVSFELGMAFSFDSDTVLGVDVDATLFELFGGVRATAELADRHLRPYIGVGPSLVMADVSGESGGFEVSDDDSDLGFYARAGVDWVFDSGFSLGFDYRKLMGTDVSLFGVDGDADYDQFALSFGFGF